jgi:CheY-like chemotaxis protein
MLASEPRQTGHLRLPATRIPTVCVVDPHVDDYQDWRLAAEAHGVELRFVASAEEALRLARAQGIDLWVVNTRLPGLSGCELCGMLKSRSGHTPVYLVADEYSPEEECAALRARATLFSCKAMRQALLDQWLVDHAHGRFQPASAPVVKG